jgi:hypothetical protein
MLGVNAIGPLINGASQVSVSYWVKFDTISGASDADFFISSRINTLLTGISATTSVSKLRAIGRSQESDALRFVVGATTLVTGIWYHVGIMYNFAVDNIIIYLNGAVDANGISGTWGSSTYVQGLPTVNSDSIGCFSSAFLPADTVRQLDGQMAELAVWKTELDANDFASLAKGFTPDQIRPQSLVAYWPMTGSGTNLQEIVNAKNGTITGSIPAADHPRVYA